MTKDVISEWLFGGNKHRNTELAKLNATSQRADVAQYFQSKKINVTDACLYYEYQKKQSRWSCTDIIKGTFSNCKLIVK